MSEIARIARLLEQTFEGRPYYGASVLGALEHVTADIAIHKPTWSVHSIWELVTHLIAELVEVVSQLDDAILDKNPVRVQGPFYVMLHGTLHHNVYHAGQISLLTGKTALGKQ